MIPERTELGMIGFMALTGRVLLVLSACALVYALCWAAWYRLPRGADEIVDMRASRTESPHYVIFCAALANNLHGFPGHAFIVWMTDKDLDLQHGESAGFGPRFAQTLIQSLYQAVPGAVAFNAAEGNRRNIEKLIVIVNKEEFEHSRQLCSEWDERHFQTGVRDCSSFLQFIAQDVGLQAPSSSYMFPQDYLTQMKSLNRRQIILRKHI